MAEQVIEHLYKLKGGEQEAVERNNPKLERREPIVVYCTDGITRLKIGDGIHRFNDLDWVGGNFTLDNDTPIENLETVYALLSKLSSDINKKVDKIEGKGLSTNDFTNQYKDKLDTIEEGATRVIVDTISLDSASDNAISNSVVAQAITNIHATMDTRIENKVSEKLQEEIESISLDGGQI